MFKKLIILFTAWRNRREIKANHNKMKEVSVVKWLSLTGVQPKSGAFPLTPTYSSSLSNRLDWIKDFIQRRNHGDTLLIGDSLSDFTRNDLSSVAPDLNLALAGQGSSFYIAILKDTKDALKEINIKYVIIECFGNEFLNYFALEDVKLHARDTFYLARYMYPNAKIILTGLPPVYDLYTNTVKEEWTDWLKLLVSSDPNSCLVLLDSLAGAFGIFPKVEYSSDGVHFAGKGILIYDELLNKAKLTNLKVIL